MPSFTSQSPQLVTAGPVVQVAIGVSQSLAKHLQSRGQPIPQAVQATAMIDTGASGTVITPSIVRQLNINPVGSVSISTPSTTQPVNAYRYNIGIAFQNNVSVASAIAIEAPLGGQNIQCLIGRDILAHAVLVYIGYTNQFTLSF